MQLLIDVSDFQSAPDEVRGWLLSRFGAAPVIATTGRPTKAAKVATAEKPQTVEKTVEKTVEPPAMEELLSRATALLEAKGTDVLKTVLANVGIKRVKDCPADKRAALLAEIAVHA
jgi:hypothetical protein